MPELTRRYVVMTLAEAAPFDHADRDAPFVLKPWKDPAALTAVKAYRAHCYPELARDLDEWIRAIEAGPSLRGDVGRRRAHLASHRRLPLAPARAARAPRGAGKGKTRRRDEGKATPRRVAGHGATPKRRSAGDALGTARALRSSR
jgi:hypothetical protein